MLFYYGLPFLCLLSEVDERALFGRGIRLTENLPDIQDRLGVCAVPFIGGRLTNVIHGI